MKKVEKATRPIFRSSKVCLIKEKWPLFPELVEGRRPFLQTALRQAQWPFGEKKFPKKTFAIFF
jgi:hypothetical protein